MGVRCCLLAMCVLAGPAGAAAPRVPAAVDCTQAAAAAERAWALPSGLLLAVGLAESGQRDPVSARLRPVPNIINVAGMDVVFSSATYAVDAVAALRGRGIGSIDVGCFQVNLHHHPRAFATLQEAFDPSRNAAYAGSFLRDLFERTGSWEAAVAAYHSADPARGVPYREHVLHLWRSLAGAGSMTGLVAPSAVHASLPQAADPHVIRMSREAAGIAVYTPATLPPALRASLAALTKF